MPEDEVDKLFKDESENQIIKTVLRLGKNKLSNLHNLLQIELDVLND